MFVIELPVCSPLLHLLVKTLDSWEEHFEAQLDSFDGVPSDLFGGSPHRGQGPALLQHKSILEPENSPFRHVQQALCYILMYLTYFLSLSLGRLVIMLKWHASYGNI